MIDRQRLLEFQTKREDDWQRWQAQMAADKKKWREGQEAEADRRYKLNGAPPPDTTVHTFGWWWSVSYWGWFLWTAFFMAAVALVRSILRARREDA